MIVVKKLLIWLFVGTASPAGHSQAFTSISIKPAASSDVQSRRTRVLPNGDLLATSVNSISLISYGYDAPGNPSERLSQLPPWVYSERYDIEAKASSVAGGGSSANDPDSFRRVFRGLLKDRFGLVMRTDSKAVPVYFLVVATDGPRLKRSATTGCVFDTAPDGCHAFQGGLGHPLNASAVDMNDLAKYIGNWTDMPVVNNTDLSGLYSTSTSGWRPLHLPPPPPGGNGSDFSQLPSLDAVLLGLGLKLEKGNAVIPYFTIEHIEQPTADQ